MQLIPTIYISSFIAGCVFVIALIKFKKTTRDHQRVFAAISCLILGINAFTWWYLLGIEPDYSMALGSPWCVFPTYIMMIFCLGVIILSVIKYPKDILLIIIAAASIVYVFYDSLLLLFPLLLYYGVSTSSIPPLLEPFLWDLELFFSLSLAYSLFALFVTLFVALSLLVNVIRTKHHK